MGQRSKVRTPSSGNIFDVEMWPQYSVIDTDISLIVTVRDTAPDSIKTYTEICSMGFGDGYSNVFISESLLNYIIN